MNRKSGNMFRNTSLRNGGRKAGFGTAYDDYSEESFGRGRVHEFEKVRFPHDDRKPEDLNGPVIVVQKGRVRNG